MAEKDDAVRRAEELVTLRVLENDNGHLFESIDIGGVHVGSTWRGEEERQAVVSIIAAAIRAEAERWQGILTDMQIDSEAWQEGFRQGAEIQRHSDRMTLLDFVKKTMLSPGQSDAICNAASLMQENVSVPSHDSRGKPIPPSRLWRNAERMEQALRFIFRDAVIAQDPSEMRRIAKEALEGADAR